MAYCMETPKNVIVTRERVFTVRLRSIIVKVVNDVITPAGLS